MDTDMMKKLYLIGFGNLIDTFATLYLYQTGMFVELNPVMAFFLRNPFIFAVVKIGVITAILIRLWKEREHKYPQIAINIGCWIYGLIAVYYAILLVLFHAI
jgi:formate-dependent nitrite reductase membrane component NrfD